MVYHGVELLFLVSMLFLLVIPKSLLILKEDKFPTRSSAVLIGLPPALGYFPFTSVRVSSYTIWVRSCPVSGARSAQKVTGKHMKRTDGVGAAVGAFLLRAFQAGFSCADVFNTLKEAYPCRSIVPRRCRLDTFLEAH